MPSLEKRYTTDFLKVPHLAKCIKGVKKLDEERDQLEFAGAAFLSQSQVDQSSGVKDKWDKLKATLEIHNREVKVCNVECKKRCYADDLDAAQKLAQSD